MASVYVNPYRWQSYTPNNSVDSLRDAPWDQLETARWISMVDEVPAGKIENATSLEYEDQVGYIEAATADSPGRALKLGQTSRRVVTMNASGVVLKDFLWTVDPSTGHLAMTGGGLGEEYHYESARTVLSALGATGLPSDEGSTVTPDPPPTRAEEHPLNRAAAGANVTGDIQFLREPVLVQKRSVGWSAAALDSEQHAETNGLVQFVQYKHFDVPFTNPSPEELKRWSWRRRLQMAGEGIQKGHAAGTRYFTKQLFRDETRPEDVRCQVEFLTPVTGMMNVEPQPTANTELTGAIRATWNRLGRTTEADESTQRVVWQSTIGTPRQLMPGSAWYYPVQRSFFNDRGALVWSASGLLKNPTNPPDQSDPLEALIFSYYGYDWLGRPALVAEDAGTPNPNPGNNLPPGLSSDLLGQLGFDPGVLNVSQADRDLLGGWQRHCLSGQSTSITARCALTLTVYNEQGEPSDVIYPSGRRFARRVVVHEQVDPTHSESSTWFAREFVINDLVATTTPNVLKSWSIGQVRDYPTMAAEGQPTKDRRVVFDVINSGDSTTVPPNTTGFGPRLLFYGQVERNGNGDPLGNTGEPAWTETVRVEMGLDANGRVSEAKLMEPINPANPDSGLLGSVEVNDLTDVLRERAVDGTITRTTRDFFGHVMRVYKGTDDDLWGNNTSGDAMTMTDRYAYGTEVTNAWKQTHHWKYDAKSECHEDIYNNAPTTDTKGILTYTTYDWRMRPVRVDSYSTPDASPASRVSTTLTFLDHANLPRLVATYGAGALPTVPDPSMFGPADFSYAPGSSLAQGLAGLILTAFSPGTAPLTSLTETLYEPDGSVRERRTYDIPEPGAPSQVRWHAERTYTGRAGVTTYSSRPGDAVQLTTVDGLGRTIAVRSIIPNHNGSALEYEVARTENTHDEDGNLIEVLSWERTLHDGANAIGATNGVCTRSYTWYDPNKRVIATANLGTGLETFSYNAAPLNRLDFSVPPKVDIVSGIATVNRQGLPDSAQVQVYEFDEAGNQTRSVDAAGVVTEYTYDNTGRLKTKIEDAYLVGDNNPSNPLDTVALRRKTSNQYRWGRLVAIHSFPTGWTESNAPTQSTKVLYGAEIVEHSDSEGWVVVSTDNSLVDRVYTLHGSDCLPGYPHTDLSGIDVAPSFPPDFQYRYTIQRQVAERIDARGRSLRYHYDTQGRLEEVEVGWYQGFPDVSTGWKGGYMDDGLAPIPLNRVGFVRYGYDNAGRVVDVGAFLSRPADQSEGEVLVIATNRYTYNARGDLVREYQSHGFLMSEQVAPFIAYTWDYAPSAWLSGGSEVSGDAWHRLVSMTYPAQTQVDNNGTPRTVTLAYGTTQTNQTGHVDHALSRITGFSTSTPALPIVEPIAQVEYVGLSRRVGLALSDALPHGNTVVDANKAGDLICLSWHHHERQEPRVLLACSRSRRVVKASIGQRPSDITLLRKGHRCRRGDCKHSATCLRQQSLPQAAALGLKYIVQQHSNNSSMTSAYTCR